MGSDTSTFTSMLVWNSDFLLSSICSTMTAISLYSRHNSEPVSWSPTPLLQITGGKWTEDLRSPTLWPDCKPVIVLCWRLPTEVGSGTMERVWAGPKVQRGEALSCPTSLSCGFLSWEVLPYPHGPSAHSPSCVTSGTSSFTQHPLPWLPSPTVPSLL